MYAVDISSNYQQRHPGSPPLSVDGQREYNAASYGSNGNRYIDDSQHKDDHFGYIEGGINPPSDLLLSQSNRFRDDREDHVNYRCVYQLFILSFLWAMYFLSGLNFK